MRHLRFVLLLLAVALCGAAMAQEDISGTWQGKLAVTPDTSLTIQFVLKAEGSGYSAVVTSPDSEGIKNVAATSVSFATNRLTVKVDELSGSYEGVLQGGTFDGNWAQPSGSIPLVLSRYEKPTLSAADVERLSGSWLGKLVFPRAAMTMVFKLEPNPSGGLIGTAVVPEQGVSHPMEEISLAGGTFSFKVPKIRAEYSGSIDGSQIVGTWRQGPGAGLPLTMARGEYVAPSFALSKEQAAKVLGTWRGQVGTVELIFRFENADGGKVAGYVDVPAQRTSNIIVTEATLLGDQLVFRVGAIGAEFNGKVSGAEIAGQWTQGPTTNPLTLKRD